MGIINQQINHSGNLEFHLIMRSFKKFVPSSMVDSSRVKMNATMPLSQL